MPVRIAVPVGGKVATRQTLKGLEVFADGEDEVVAPPSLSDLFEVYGSPSISGGVRQVTDYSEVDGKLVAHSTFEAVDPAEQSDVDDWAAQIEADSEQKIRSKVKSNRKATTLPALKRRKL